MIFMVNSQVPDKEVLHHEDVKAMKGSLKDILFPIFMSFVPFMVNSQVPDKEVCTMKM
jgi:hypothetical protein